MWRLFGSDEAITTYAQSMKEVGWRYVNLAENIEDAAETGVARSATRSWAG